MTYNNSRHFVDSAKELFNRKQDLGFFIKRAKGIYLYDYDHHKFIDFFLNKGSLILGHAHPRITKAIKNAVSRGYQFAQPVNLELRLAKIIMECYRGIERIKFCNSKAMALKAIIDMVKRVTQKQKTIFLGYNGLIGFDNAISLPFFEIDELDDILSNIHNDVGAICLDFLRLPMVSYASSFFSDIRDLCNNYNLLFVLDEEVSGFRLSLGGAIEYYGLEPDIVLLGRVIGGGFPLYAVGGKSEFFNTCYNNRDSLYSPIYYTAGIETIKILKKTNPYLIMEKLVKMLCFGVNSVKIRGMGSIFSIEKGNGYSSLADDLLKKGFFLYPPLDSLHFISTEHKEEHIIKLIDFLNKMG